MQRFSCAVAGMERFSLDFLQAVKKRCALKVGCRDERNLWSQANIFLTLQFEVGASNEKSCLLQSLNVACADCSRLNSGVGSS